MKPAYLATRALKMMSLLTLSGCIAFTLLHPTVLTAQVEGRVYIDNSRFDAGKNAGYRDGRNQGAAKGRSDGNNKGNYDGYQQGFNQCKNNLENRNYNQGYRDGEIYGAEIGYREGERDGRAKGIREGRSKGYQHGKDQADTAARNNSYGPGQQQGLAEAESSNATSEGRRNGIRDGDRQALRQADSKDYNEGRNSYRAQRENEAITNTAVIALKQAATEEITVAEAVQSEMPVFELPPITTQNDSSLTESTASNDGGYQRGYNSTFNNAYTTAYWEAYYPAYNYAAGQAKTRGCNEATYNRNYRYKYNEGYTAGRDKERYRTYWIAHRNAYNAVYQRTFNSSSDSAYDKYYDNFYAQYFEEARSSAYESRYESLYYSAYNPAKEATYDQKYPDYAKAAYDRGIADEKQDFIDRPIRLINDAKIIETIENGIFEPGEELNLTFSLRNFSDETLNGSEIMAAISAFDSTGVIFESAFISLPESIQPKSETLIERAFAFKLNDRRIDEETRFMLQVNYKDYDVGSDNVAAKAQYVLGLALDSKPRLQEGIMAPVVVRVTNRGNIAVAEGTSLTLQTELENIEIALTDKSLPVLAAGETTLIEYQALTRSEEKNITIPFEITASIPNRTVGYHLANPTIALVNDYRIVVTDDDAKRNLQNKGVIRIPYRVTNANSKTSYKSLQLHIRFKGDADNTSHSVIGPNPQYLKPLLKDEIDEFMIPIQVHQQGASGIMELELKEDGNTVVINQLKF